SILDVTAATPSVTVGQRRALLVRDPRCRFPGCSVIAQRCDTHHLHHQASGGQHRLDNLVHLCRHHHRFVHEHRWTITGTPDTDLHVHPPPEREPDHWLERTGIDTP
ncbi:MAG: HNH endonuclease signature motif containing protein, partial [Actinomycetota bacterium]